MILYSAVPPMFEDNKTVPEMFSDCEKGSLMFYEKDSEGNKVLKFSTDPKFYLESKKTLQ
ncbi:MAG: hypothetical protein E7481_06395 [Ruminococcaceae bacterium]|nr:hypothetical protein [Oscillospiraceae bacterium]